MGSDRLRLDSTFTTVTWPWISCFLPGARPVDPKKCSVRALIGERIKAEIRLSFCSFASWRGGGREVYMRD